MSEGPPQLFRQAALLHKSGKLGEAEQLCRQILDGAPGDADALYMLGIIFAQQGCYPEALERIGAALAIRPDAAAMRFQHANVLQAAGQLEQALADYDRVLAAQPDFAEALNNHADTLYRLSRLDEALASVTRALALNPDFAAGHFTRGNILQGLKRSEEALESYARTIARRPDYAPAHANRGNVLKSLRRFPEALDAYDTAIRLKPDVAEVFSNRGNVLKDLERFDEALASYDRAIALQPGYASAHLNKGLCSLLLGRFAEGWPLYEWRKAGPPRAFAQPVWLGKEDISGKTLLVQAEQGFGDTIQFSRYAALAQARGAKVILLAPDGLARLLQGLDPAITIADSRTVLPEFDFQVPLLSLPLAFGTGGGTIPARPSYLRAEGDKVRAWKDRIGERGFKIGIGWQGNPQAAADAGRSFALRHFQSLSQMPGSRLISLQKNDGAEQLADLPPGMTVERLEGLDDGTDAFVDSAAVMENLDLVITSDTALAHLAGALGRPVWVALAHVPDWRFFLGRADSPWYPTMRLFRQPAPGDWASVFADMQASLASVV